LKRRSPRLIVVVPIEGRVVAYADVDAYEDERRLALELATRDLVAELNDALTALLDALDDRRAA
jgi:hypothetical protein